MPLTKKKVRQPGRISYAVNSKNFLCLVLAAKVRSNACIRRKTNLSDGQIYYRLKQHNIRRMDIRDGYGPIARIIDDDVTRHIENYLIQHIERML
jgi:hypothetical protein